MLRRLSIRQHSASDAVTDEFKSHRLQLNNEIKPIALDND